MSLYAYIYRDSYSVWQQHSFHCEEAQVLYLVFVIQDLSSLSTKYYMSSDCFGTRNTMVKTLFIFQASIRGFVEVRMLERRWQYFVRILLPMPTCLQADK